MIRLSFVAPLLVVFACGTTHLGPDTNAAYHAAFDAQRTSEPTRKPTFTADDGHATNAARRRDKGKASASTAPAPGSITLPLSSSSSSNGAWQGAQGSISLEAK